MNSKKETFKVGDSIKVRHDLPVTDPNFRDTSPGWIEDMDDILGKVGKITSVEPTCYEVRFKNGRQFYIGDHQIDINGTRVLSLGNSRDPIVGDWVVYFESEDDREIATLGKVTACDEETGSWSVDGCSGFYYVYLFEGDVKLIDKIRSGEM